VTDATPDRLLEADLCVIGAGPAGVTLTREFLGTGIQVVLLESGGYGFDEQAQALSSSEVDSSHHAPDSIGGQRRQFGGASNLWVYRTMPDDGRRQARSVPPEPIDFEPRFGSPATGWPMSFEALRPFYERAQRIWNGGPFDHSVHRWAGGAELITTSESRLTTKVSQHGPNDVFRFRYRDDLRAADNVRVLVGCTALQLESGTSGDRIDAVHVAGANGERFAVRARAFALAGGGIENAQLLLLSPSGAPGGPGNPHDTIGRYLTDHPEHRLGSVVASDPSVLDRLGLYDLRWIDEFMVSGFLTIKEEVKRQEQLLNLSVVFVLHAAGFGSDAHRALLALTSARSVRPADVVGTARVVLGAPGDAVRAIAERRGRQYEEWAGGWSRADVDRRNLPVIELHGAPEQTAHRENRVTLGSARDRFGRLRPRIIWRWSPSDRENLERSTVIVREELKAAGIGRLRPWVSMSGRHAPRFGGFHHPMGATRMHPDPREGVVDADCRVHGIENVFVAGSSVFPTGHGYANPTLSIIALAVRLGEHLRGYLDR